MQKGGLKILIIVLIALIPLVTRGNKPLLAKADSLFQEKRYTQSLEIYQALFEDHHYSPAMLLKMAYIQEGLNRIAQSTYYLNLYYLATHDDSALTKLEELAGKYKLEGYSSDEISKIYSLYQQYKNLVTLVLASVIATWCVLLLMSVVLLMHINLSDRFSQAIIVNNNTYLMDKPSAGASVIEIVRDGHRVKILGKKDVWIKVTWGDSEVYIKESSVLPIQL